MDIIHLLPDTVANQIAAGEVVQRPASVIKELLENSIDAHATQIQIILRQAGRELIQVIDNGQGMSPTDARMAFEKHATSKIHEAADLFDLHTMGFRGEALASIAAVAEVELRTRREGDETGVLIALAGSRLQRQEAVACPVGANFQVRNLFFNVPARRKFLKSNSTELSNVLTEVQHVALANPSVEFSVTNDDAPLLQLSVGGLKQRIVQLFQKSYEKQLLPIQMDNELLSVNGFVASPESARKKGAQQFFFVNGRYMRHPYFHKAVMECYQELIPEGSQPNYFIFLTVDPKTIDVNIHPTKTEIKFENEPARWHILMATIREALGKFNAVPTIDFDQPDLPEIPPIYQTLSSSGDGGARRSGPAEPKPEFQAGFNPFHRDRNLPNWQTLYGDFEQSTERAAYAEGDAGLKPPFYVEGDAEIMLPGGDEVPLSDAPEDSVGGGYESLGSRMSLRPQNAAQSMTMPAGEAAYETAPSAMTMLSTEAQDAAMADLASGSDGVGGLLAGGSSPRLMQVSGRFIAMQGRQGLLLIDQHRAHVSVLFDRYYTQICHRKGLSQRELFPEVIEVQSADVPILEQIMPDLQYLGFELDSLGGGSYSMNGRPASLGHTVDVHELLLQMIDAARGEVHGLTEALDRKLALRLAQAQAIPAGKALNDEEMKQLVQSLLALTDSVHTPDGKLVMAQLPTETLVSLF